MDRIMSQSNPNQQVQSRLISIVYNKRTWQPEHSHFQPKHNGSVDSGLVKIAEHNESLVTVVFYKK